MKQNKKRFSPPAVGGSSLLIIFAVLCLTVFALLTLSTARADERLSDVSADAVMAYYQADLEAEKIFSDLRCGEIPEGVEIRENLYSYSCSISSTQTLCVELRLDGGKWTVLRWQSVTSNA